jgi:neutral ceramidase
LSRWLPALFALACFTLLGCGPHGGVLPTPHLPPPVSSHRPASVLRVGAARVDITPPPGVSLFGHGPEGRVADGYWSRLYCRAFVFLPDAATPLSVVTCDLGAIGTLLQRTVASEPAIMKLGLPASRLMITATHTHAAPAHYFEGDFYGGIMSSRAPGFDPKMLAFLSTRIATAIAQAAHDAKPALLSTRHATAWGFSRNRSLVPFRQNDPPYAPDVACGWAAAPGPTLPELRAIDPCLDVLTVHELGPDGSKGGPIGSLSFFAMHPTVLPNTTRLLGADVYGVVSRVVEREMRDEWQKKAPGEAAERDPVHAIVNTNEGDLSPAWTAGSVAEAIEIGSHLGKRIVEASNDAKAVPAIVDARYAEVHLPNARLFADSRRRLCETPTLGVATPKGGSDHPTALSFIGDFRDENIDLKSSRPCEAPRIAFLDIIQRHAAGSGAFPEDAPLAVVQLGDTIISFVPAELTITAGGRLNRAVAREAEAGGLGATRALVGGLANGYFQYVTTEEEYFLQHYEGASTIYGVWTARFFEERYALLTRAMAGVDVSPWLGPVDRVAPRPYVVAARRDRLPTGDNESPAAAVRGRGQRFLCRLPGTERTFCFAWTDAAPGVVPPTKVKKDLSWLSLVDANTGKIISERGDPRGGVDDRGLWFQTRAVARADDGYTWTTVLDLSTAAVDLGGPVKIRAHDGTSPVDSPAFLPEPPKTCSARQVLTCGIGR